MEQLANIVPMAPPGDWPERTCSCGAAFRHPHGGEGPCDTCIAEAERLRTEKAQPTFDLCSDATLQAAIDLELEQVLSRGCHPDLGAASRATWERNTAGKTPTPWQKIFDRWPDRVIDEASGTHPRAIYLYGPTGCGKSHVAAWIMRRAIAAGLPAGWVNVPAAIAAEKRSIRTGETIQAWQQVTKGFCVLDDIGAHRTDSAYQEDIVYQFVESLYAGPLAVYTSNLTPNELRELHPRAASRIMSGPHVEMVGEDARRKKWKLT